MRITKYNKLIAEFMGFHEIMLDEHSKYDTDDVSNILEIDSLPKLDTINPEKLNFHTSWDWLMPVVEKIESLEETYDKERLAIKIGYSYNTSCSKNHNLNNGTWSGYISRIRDGHTFVTVIGNSRIEATYKSVIEFIKWYNNENK
jgi:hypothetical protein